mmetsp:Transcript_104060/g.179276  ORF Transcript_104060/g.179276 Transcript_104060/m.179276 type:complete len:201 (-) Transcript_104060:123-725(-)
MVPSFRPQRGMSQSDDEGPSHLLNLPDGHIYSSSNDQIDQTMQSDVRVSIAIDNIYRPHQRVGESFTSHVTSNRRRKRPIALSDPFEVSRIFACGTCPEPPVIDQSALLTLLGREPSMVGVNQGEGGYTWTKPKNKRKPSELLCTHEAPTTHTSNNTPTQPPTHTHTHQYQLATYHHIHHLIYGAIRPWRRVKTNPWCSP